jgi:hypothetical protein
MAAPVLQFKRGAFANLPGLRAGEPALTTDTFDLYVGIDSSTNNNKFFGSHRYWTKETATTGSGVRFVERTDGGSNYIEIKAPNTALAGDVTYVLPGTQGNASSVLTNDGSGNLTWSSGSDSPVFTGISTFSDTTDNVLGNENTGSVQLDGGMGIAKNLTVKQNLHVGGYSEFVGVVTFKGGTINLGDEDTDDIVVAGEFKSSLHPTDDASYDIGNGGASKRWRNASFSGIGTFATGAVADGIQIGITGATEIDTSAGVLTLDSAGGQVVIDDNLSVTGVSTFTGAIDANGGADISGGETTLSSATVSDLTAGRVVLAGTSGALEDSSNLTFNAGGLIVGAGGVNVTGVSTFSTNVVVDGDLRVNGNDIQASDGNTNITLTSNTLTTFAGDIKVTGNDIQASDGNVNITMTSNTLTEVKGDLKVTGNDIQSSTGTVAITLADNDVTIADDLTVQGNLYVNGSTTQVNTAALTVEDRTIDLGIVNGTAPSSDTTWDLGVLFNYYTSGAAKKSAVVWEHADSRFKFASVLGADTDGTDANTPQLTVTTFAPIEIGALWVNDCAGQSQVISCTGNVRNLENITIDAGTW